MIAVRCSACFVELDEPGALMFGPPVAKMVTQRHVCKTCWTEILDWIYVAAPAVTPEDGA